MTISPFGSFWLGLAITAQRVKVNIPKLPEKAQGKISVEFDVEAFQGSGGSSNTEVFFLNVRSVTLNLAVVPLLKLGRAVGGFWANPDTPEGNMAEMCRPSGFFLKIQAEIGIPGFDGYLRNFFDIEDSARADVGVLIRGNQFNGLVLRVSARLAFLRINLGSINMEFQYITATELHRRKQFLTNQTLACCAQYDQHTGLCADYGAPTGQDVGGGITSGLRPVDFWLYNQQEGDYILVFMGASRGVDFVGGLVQLTETDILTAFRVDVTGPFYIYLECKITVLMVADFDTTVIVTDSSIYFALTISVVGIDTTVTGISSGYTTINQPVQKRQSANDTQSLEDAEFHLSVSVDFSAIAREVAAAVNVAINAVAGFAVKTWNEVAGQITDLGNQIKNFFEPGGILANFLTDIGTQAQRFFDDLANGVLNALDSVIHNFEKSWNTLVDGGNKLAHGDVLGALQDFGTAVGQALDIGYETENNKVVFTGNYDKFGCQILQQKWQKCFKFIFSFDCHEQSGDPYSDPSCVQQKMTAAHTAQKLSQAQGVKINLNTDSQNENQGLIYAHSVGLDAIPADQLNLGSNNISVGSSNPSTLRRRAMMATTMGIPVQVPQLDNTTPGLKPGGSAPTYMATFNDLSNSDAFALDLQRAKNEIQGLATQTALGDNAGISDQIKQQVTAKQKPAIIPPPTKTFTCATNIYANTTQLLGLPQLAVVDPACAPASPQFTVHLTQNPQGGVCGGLEITAKWTFTDTCNQAADPVTQLVSIHPEPPKFVSTPADMTISCENDASPLTTGSPDVVGGCANAGVRVDYVDSPMTFKRTWTAKSPGCPGDSTQSASFIQTITVVDKTPPYWEASFPKDATVAFLAPYGTQELGWPSAYDSCGKVPVRISYTDTVNPLDDRCAAEKVVKRTWTAKDSCGNTATRAQIITFVNTQRLLGGATRMSLWAGASSNIASVSIAGQVEALGSLTAANNKIGFGSCSFGGMSLLLQSTSTLFNNAVYNGNQTSSPNWYNFTQDVNGVGAFSNKLGSVTDLHRGPILVNCLDGHVKVPSSVDFMYKITNFDSSTNCTTVQSKTYDTIASVATATSYTLTGTDLVYNIYTLPATVLTKAAPIVITAPSTSVNIINVVGVAAINVNTPSMQLVGPNPRTVLWNFANVPQIAFPSKNLVWLGSILAPKAYFMSTGGTVQGQLFAGKGVNANSLAVQCWLWSGFRFCADKESTVVAKP
ncbi:hypothetical protein HDU86_008336 [Geranomyces michiganensis]|nr:hypothetical protein HDU86_008336 [Geranomyces michiganensis]